MGVPHLSRHERRESVGQPHRQKTETHPVACPAAAALAVRLVLSCTAAEADENGTEKPLKSEMKAPHLACPNREEASISMAPVEPVEYDQR